MLLSLKNETKKKNNQRTKTMCRLRMNHPEELIGLISKLIINNKLNDFIK